MVTATLTWISIYFDEMGFLLVEGFGPERDWPRPFTTPCSCAFRQLHEGFAELHGCKALDTLSLRWVRPLAANTVLRRGRLDGA